MTDRPDLPPVDLSAEERAALERLYRTLQRADNGDHEISAEWLADLAVRVLRAVPRLAGSLCPWCTAPVPTDDPVRPLGERLASWLDADHFNNVEPLLNDLRRRLAQTDEERDRLAGFAAWVMRQHTGTIDGCDIEEVAVRFGLMDAVTCDGTCAECEGVPGEDTCYRPHRLLNNEGSAE